ncbi:MAG: SPOR domain-containing protein [Balneolaceae bacterium]
MKIITGYVVVAFLSIAFLQGCGPSEEELRQQELARLDSLQQVYQAEMEQMRQDSLAQAEQSEAETEPEEESLPSFSYSESGEFSVQIEAWRSREKAENQAERWRQRDFDRAFVVEYGNPEGGDVWYRVRLGKFDTYEMASNFKAFIETNHNTTTWVSRAGEPLPEDVWSE